jgi:hypothetical protein
MYDSSKTDSKILICGVMMPISSIDGCPESHWGKVRKIIFDSIGKARFSPQLVSDGDRTEVIQTRILRNLYFYPIAVCDVSANNPNVLLELGIRLAFNKPVIIIKDDMTPYSFDISNIEQIQYPRDLNKALINKFKNKLIEKIINTYKVSILDPEYSSFMNEFGKSVSTNFKVEEIPVKEAILSESKFINSTITNFHLSNAKDNLLMFVVPSYKMDEINNIIRAIRAKDGVLELIEGESTNRVILNVIISNNADRNEITTFIRDLLNS